MTTFSYDPQPIIDQASAEFFESESLLSPIVNNKRMISATLISPPSSISLSTSESSRSASRVSPRSFSATYVVQEMDEIELPANLISRETYEFLGYDSSTAEALWHRFWTQPADDDMEVDLLELALCRIEYWPREATCESDDWDALMMEMGINDQLRHAIMLPEYTEIRYTASCHYWLMEAMNVKWHALEALADELRSVAYFTPQRETANQYAEWSKRKFVIENIAIVQVAVPWALLESLSTQCLWSDGNTSETWKEVVWHGRRGYDLPGELEPIEKKDVWIGHILSGRHVKYERLKSSQEIKDSDVLKLQIDEEEKRAIQWSFQTRRARGGFEEHCRGKVWIHRLGALSVPRKAGIVNLDVGEALLFAPSTMLAVERGVIEKLGMADLKVRIRSRLSTDGGRSVLAS
ncbi:MAG: hypothetical protein M1826_005407 [Phylliscum demangeonii]|nr:MAG: hypothetical protein M1826_005407 [Phylliscum demangeonii]